MKQFFRYLLLYSKYRYSSFTWSSEISLNSQIGKGGRFGKDIQFINSKVERNFKQEPKSICLNIEAGNDCAIGNGAKLLNCKLGNFVRIGNDSRLYTGTIGKHSYLSSQVLLFNTQIGNFCSIGPRVIFGHGDHPLDRLSTSPEFYTKGSATGHFFIRDESFNEFIPIKIGNDVWIGANVYIKHGISVGDGAVIAANAVVTKDVEPYSIVGGVPAKFLKKRFENSFIDKLLELKWWKWDDEKIKRNKFIFEKEYLKNGTFSDIK